MDEVRDISALNLIVFTPERWNEVQRFQKLHSSTYQFNRWTDAALRGVTGHFYKALRLRNLAKRLSPFLIEDAKELHEKGYTPNVRSVELAAVIETIFCELYSSLDCTRQVIGGIYGRLPGIPDKSTWKLFKNAEEGKIDDRVPKEIRDSFRDALYWVKGLHDIRSTVVHTDIGNCHLDHSTGLIRYIHSELGTENKTFVTNDVFQEIQSYLDQVDIFLGRVFKELNLTLKDNEVRQVCGLFGGRIYARYVRPSEARDFHSGRCDSYKWFEVEENPDCPFMNSCEAYKRAKQNAND
jgi:hypothetical protein